MHQQRHSDIVNVCAAADGTRQMDHTAQKYQPEQIEAIRAAGVCRTLWG
jgi:hypothetical protein